MTSAFKHMPWEILMPPSAGTDLRDFVSLTLDAEDPCTEVGPMALKVYPLCAPEPLLFGRLHNTLT